ncbi:MAG: hypothetical protein AAF587_06935 [Bacteroidota bacterium]
MKSPLYFSFISLFLLSFVLMSCVQQTDILDPTYVPAELKGQDYLDNYTTPVIMFHYVSIDDESNSASGWMISNTGEVHQYQSSDVPFVLEGQQASISLIKRVLESSTVRDEKVDLVEMVEQYRKTHKIDREKLDITPSKGAASTSYFLAYDLDYNGQCEDGTCPGVEPSKTKVSQFIVKVEGNFIGKNSSIQAEQITSWLEDLKSGF